MFVHLPGMTQQGVGSYAHQADSQCTPEKGVLVSRGAGVVGLAGCGATITCIGRKASPAAPGDSRLSVAGRT